MGKYLLLERLATGGMAEVYRAKTTGASGFEKHLAIKKILPTHVEDETFQRMFETEARIGSSLQHSNIVQILDFVKFSETFLLVMEFVNGRNLRQVINKLKKLQYSLPLECSLYIINETCKGLDYAHTKKDDFTGQAQNIIHRDMSPQNIMISYEGLVKIVDFGIANWKDKLEQTKSGVIKGKFGYMSPEQAAGQNITHLTDVFSTGIIFWELLTGKRLFTAESDLATLRLIQDCVIPKPSSLNPRVTPELERIVLKALSKSTTHRYQSAGAMQRQIQEYLNKHYPSFRGNEIAAMMQRLFKEEISSDNRRFEILNKQSVPFSQSDREQSGTPESEDDISAQLEGSLTSASVDKITQVTFSDGEKAPEPEQETPLRANEAEIKTRVATPLRPAEKEPSLSRLDSTISKTKSQQSVAEPTLAKQNPTRPSGVYQQTQAATRTSGTGTRQQTQGQSDKSVFLDLEGSQTSKSRRESWGTFTTDFGTENSRKVEPQRSRFLSGGGIIAASLFLGVTAYLYHLLLSGRSVIPVKVEGVNPRAVGSCDPAVSKTCQLPKTAPSPAGEKAAPVKTCELRFETDPPGAVLLIDGVEKFVTPGTALVPCDSSINYSLQLKEYEILAENIFVKAKSKPIFKTLRKIETGSIQLVTNRRVKIFNETDFLGETEPGKPFVIERIPTNRSVRLRFSNEVFGIDETRSFNVKAGVTTPYEVKLDEAAEKN